MKRMILSKATPAKVDFANNDEDRRCIELSVLTPLTDRCIGMRLGLTMSQVRYRRQRAVAAGVQASKSDIRNGRGLGELYFANGRIDHEKLAVGIRRALYDADLISRKDIHNAGR